MKLLFKQAIKSIFSNKIFTIVMIAIVLVGSITYTLFQSAGNAFLNSYNNVMNKGNLHDAIIKEKYTITGSYNLKMGTIDKPSSGPFSAKIEWNANASSPTEQNDYYDFLNSHYHNKIITIVYSTSKSTTIQEKEAEVKKLAKEAISNANTLINKNVSGGKSIDFEKAISDIYKNDLTIASTKSLAIGTTKNAYKIVTSDTIDPANDYLDGFKKANDDDPYNKPNKHNVNKLIIYDGTNQFTENQTNTAMRHELSYRAQLAGFNLGKATISRIKGYRWTATSQAGITVQVTDPSSYEAVISPSYANVNDKLSISPSNFLALYQKYNYASIDEFMNGVAINEKHLQEIYKHNLMWVDKTPYFIIGVGTTPDFGYPIVDPQHPTPKINSQAIVFTNRRGYERMYDAFRTAPQENYLSIKFLPGISKTKQDEIKSQIEVIARKGNSALNKFGLTYKDKIPTMSWPLNVKIVTNYNDTNDNILLAEQRVAFLEKLKNTLASLAFITTLMLLIFISAIIILVFSALISSKRKVIATLLSLGYRRVEIAFSFGIITLIIGAAPSIIGYIVGHFLQYAFINIFSSYWTIPVYGQLFSIYTMLIVVILPVVGIFLLIFIICLWETRFNVVSMLHDNIIQFNKLSSLLKHFKWLGIKTKYTISLVFTNFWRLLLVSITGIISVSALIIGMSTIGKAQYAFNATQAIYDYSYKVDLFTPTDEGGLYNLLNYKDLSSLPTMDTYDKSFPSSKKLAVPHWHLPSYADVQYANLATLTINKKKLPFIARYLRNKIETKAFLDFDIANTKGFNPWSIAAKLMPDNQRNQANDNEKKFFPSVKPEINKTTGGLTPGFKGLVINHVRNAPYKNAYPYMITYQNIIKNQADETYTYISANYQQKQTTHKYSIIGYKRNSKYIKIPNILTQELINHEHDNSIPILINQYIAENLGLSVGSQINMAITNKANRFINKNKPVPKQSFTVRGIVNSYDDGGIFTLQSIANTVTGLDSVLLEGNQSHKLNTFNGILTKNTNPVIFNTLPLYSPSSLYLATDVVIGDWQTWIQKSLQYVANTYAKKSINNFINTYSNTLYVGSFSNINWININRYTFNSISSLSSYLIWIIQFISILLSIFFTLIVSWLFVDSNFKRIATLWTLGYRRREITRMFVSTYIFPTIISLIIALPVSFAIVSIMRLLVMNFGHILIPFAISWWIPFVAIFIIAIIFVSSIVVRIAFLKSSDALNAFKGDE